MYKIITVYCFVTILHKNKSIGIIIIEEKNELG